MSVCRYCEHNEAIPLRGGLRVLYCSTLCRARAKQALSGASSQSRRKQHIAVRIAAARTSAERAQIVWDALRAVIYRLPPARQEEAWRQVTGFLTKTTASIDAEKGGRDV